MRGPLHGIPIVYKDNIDTAGTLTTVGSEFFSKRVPQADAHVVSRLKRAGVIMIAKANMNEFSRAWPDATSTLATLTILGI